MDQLLAALDRWKPFTALVVGDFMLDQLVYGEAERLAADAPVPVLHVRKKTENPGGAANVCLDLVALGGRVEAFGVVGDDAIGAALREALEREKIGTNGIVVDEGRPTTLKQNLVGLAQARHPQKMFRVDYESRDGISEAVTRKLLAALEEALARADVVCIEDYGKGVCGEALCQGVIALARRAGKPVLVDPAKIADYSKYRGCTAITPNRTEAELATGIGADGDGAADHNARLARTLADKVACEAAVLTLDRHGALLFVADREPPPASQTRPPPPEARRGTLAAIPTIAREVYDVTGAGDMFLAGLAAARANGIGWEDSVRFANAAAGLEVEVFGVVPIPFEKVRQEILLRSGRAMGKVRTVEQAVAEVERRRGQSEQRKAKSERGPGGDVARGGAGGSSGVGGSAHPGARVVFTNGCFDIIHAGHVALIERAAALGDFLVIGLNSDASVRGLKRAGRPVNNQDDRARVLGAIEGVGAIVIFDEPTPIKLIEAIRPDVLVKGADYTKERVVGGAFVESYGGKVELVPLVVGKSTTGILDRANA